MARHAREAAPIYDTCSINQLEIFKYHPIVQTKLNIIIYQKKLQTIDSERAKFFNNSKRSKNERFVS